MLAQHWQEYRLLPGTERRRAQKTRDLEAAHAAEAVPGAPGVWVLEGQANFTICCAAFIVPVGPCEDSAQFG